MFDNNIVIGISFIIGIYALFFYLVYRYEKNRSKALQAEATKLGYKFEKKVSDDFKNKYRSFYLSSIGTDEGIINRMWREQDSYTISVFEHKYTTSSGEDSSTTKHSVISFTNQDNSLPSFSLTPKSSSQNLAGQVGGFIGDAIEDFLGNKSEKTADYKKIILKPNSGLTNNHQLTGKDEAAIQQIFNQELIELLEKEPELYIENRADTFVCYYKSTRYKAKEINPFIEKMKNIRQLFGSNNELKLKL